MKRPREAIAHNLSDRVATAVGTWAYGRCKRCVLVNPIVLFRPVLAGRVVPGVTPTLSSGDPLVKRSVDPLVKRPSRPLAVDVIGLGRPSYSSALLDSVDRATVDRAREIGALVASDRA